MRLSYVQNFVKFPPYRDPTPRYYLRLPDLNVVVSMSVLEFRLSVVADDRSLRIVSCVFDGCLRLVKHHECQDMKFTSERDGYKMFGVCIWPDSIRFLIKLFLKLPI